MIFIILGLILGVAYAIYNCYDLEDKIFGSILGGMLGGLAGGLIALLMGVVGYLFSWWALETVTVTESHELVQISDTTYNNVSGNIGGGIFVIRGNIGTDLAAGFSYYQKEEDGFSLKTAGTGNTTIKYTNDTPRVETTRTYCPATEKGVSIGPLWVNHCPVGGGNTWNTIYVPENSIIESFTLGGEQ